MSAALVQSFEESNPDKRNQIERWLLKRIDYQQKHHLVSFIKDASYYLTSFPDMRRWQQDFRARVFSAIEDKDMKEDLEKNGLVNWLHDVGHLVPVQVPRDGNCLLHSVSTAVWGISDRKLVLRRLLVLALSVDHTHHFHSRWLHQHEIHATHLMNGLHNSAAEVIEKEWTEIQQCLEPVHSHSAAVPHRFLESVHVYALANVLRRPIIVVCDPTVHTFSGMSIQDNDMGGIYLPLEWSSMETSRTPIILGYSHCHFCPLLPVAQTNQTVDGIVKKRHFVPLMNSRFEQIPVRYLLPEEEVHVGELLWKYLKVKEIGVQASQGFQTILSAELKVSQLPDELNLVPDYFQDCRQRLQQKIYFPPVEQHHRKMAGAGAGIHGLLQQSANAPPVAQTSGICRHNKSEQWLGMPTHERVIADPGLRNGSVLRQSQIHIPPPSYSRYGKFSQQGLSLNPSFSEKCVVANCKYYGDPELGMMCSNCFRDYTIKDSRKMAASGAYASVLSAPLVSVPTEGHIDLSMMSERCKDRCGYRCSTKTHPYCHECFAKHQKEMVKASESVKSISAERESLIEFIGAGSLEGMSSDLLFEDVGTRVSKSSKDLITSEGTETDTVTSENMVVGMAHVNLSPSNATGTQGGNTVSKAKTPTITSEDTVCQTSADVQNARQLSVNVQQTALSCGHPDEVPLLIEIDQQSSSYDTLISTVKEQSAEQSASGISITEQSASWTAVTEQSTSETLVTEQSVSGIAVTEQSASGTAVTDQAASGRAVTEQAASGTAVTKQAAFGTAITDQSVSGIAVMEQSASDAAITEQAASCLSITEQAASCLSVTEQTVSGTAVTKQAASGTAVTEQTASGIAVTEQAASGTAVTEQAASGTAVTEQAASGTAVTKQAASGTAVTEKAASRIAVTEQAASGIAVTEQAASGTAVTEQAPSGIAVTEQAASGTAVTEQTASGIAVTEQAASGTAVTEQAASGTAVTEQAASGTAVTEQAASGTAVTKQAASGIAVTEKAATRIAVTEQTASGIAVTEQAASGTAVTKQAASGIAVTEKAATRIAVTEQAAFGTAVTEQAASGTAVTKQAASGIAVTEKAASRIAVTEQAASGTAVTEQAASGTAVTEQAASGIAVTEQAASGTAVTEQAAPGTAITEQAASGTAVTEQAASGTAITKQNNHKQISAPNTKIIQLQNPFYEQELTSTARLMQSQAASSVSAVDRTATCATPGCSETAVLKNLCRKCFVNQDMNNLEAVCSSSILQEVKVMDTNTSESSSCAGCSNSIPICTAINVKMVPLEENNQDSGLMHLNKQPPLSKSLNYVGNWLSENCKSAEMSLRKEEILSSGPKIQPVDLPETHESKHSDLLLGADCHSFSRKCVGCNGALQQGEKLCQPCQNILKNAKQEREGNTSLKRQERQERIRCKSAQGEGLTPVTRKSNHTITVPPVFHQIHIPPDQQGQMCIETGCTMYGDPKQSGMCWKHYQKHLSKVLKKSLHGMPVPSSIINPEMDRQSVSGRTEKAHCGILAPHQVSVTSLTLPVYKMQSGMPVASHEPSLGETYYRVAGRHINKCLKSDCTHYGNRKNGGLCNGCAHGMNGNFIGRLVFGEEEIG